eukprot:6487811-Amphidinium_carterae.1
MAGHDQLITEDGPGKWGIAAVAARLTPNLNAGHMRHASIAAVHICNILAKRPQAVLAHLATLKEFFLRNEIDIAYVDANQASFARSPMVPSTIDMEFTAEAGYLQSGAGGSLHCISPVDTAQCTGFLINQQYLRNRLQLWSHGTWVTSPSDLALRESDQAYVPQPQLFALPEPGDSCWLSQTQQCGSGKADGEASCTQPADGSKAPRPKLR